MAKSFDSFLEALGLEPKNRPQPIISPTDLPLPTLVLEKKVVQPKKSFAKQKKSKIKKRNANAKPPRCCRYLLKKFFKNNPRLPITSVLGQRLVGTYDRFLDEEKSAALKNQQEFCNTFEKHTEKVFPVVTRKKHIVDAHRCHQYSFSKTERCKRESELTIGIKETSFKALNLVKPVSIRLTKLTKEELEEVTANNQKIRRSKRKWQFLNYLDRLVPKVAVYRVDAPASKDIQTKGSDATGPSGPNGEKSEKDRQIVQSLDFQEKNSNGAGRSRRSDEKSMKERQIFKSVVVQQNRSEVAECSSQLGESEKSKKCRQIGKRVAVQHKHSKEAGSSSQISENSEKRDWKFLKKIHILQPKVLIDCKIAAKPKKWPFMKKLHLFQRKINIDKLRIE